jgi:acyl-CoA reductase-like NAD-dependent aldehyde dehydrogenase
LGIDKENLGCYNNGEWKSNKGGEHISMNPFTNKPIAKTALGSLEDYDACVKEMQKEKAKWAKLPGPARGEIVRQIGDALREYKD